MLHKQALLQASAAANKRCCCKQVSAAASKRATSCERYCKRCSRRRYCLRLLLHLQAHAPLPPRSCDLRPYDLFSGREENEEGGGPIFSLWWRCLHVERRGAQVRSHVGLLVLAAAFRFCSLLLLLLLLLAAAAVSVQKVGTTAACTPSVLLVECRKGAAAAAFAHFSNEIIQYLGWILRIFEVMI